VFFQKTLDATPVAAHLLLKCNYAPDDVKKQVQVYHHPMAYKLWDTLGKLADSGHRHQVSGGGCQVSGGGPVAKKQRTKTLDAIVHKCSRPEKEKIDLAIMNFVGTCGLPFKIVDHPGFTSMLSSMNPAYVRAGFPSRRSLAATQLPKVYASLTQKVKLIQSSHTMDLVTLGLDGYTSPGGASVTNLGETKQNFLCRNGHCKF